MANQSQIQWTDATWNPWYGCHKVSKGCKYCYMFRERERYKANPDQVIRSKTRFNDPLKWEKPRMIFTCSWSDFFVPDADLWRDEAWDIIRKTPHHTYQILTKRPERIEECLPSDWGEGYDNVWIGVTIEDQESANIRIPVLNDVWAKVKFISFEPLLDEITLWAPELRFHTWDKYFTPEGDKGADLELGFDWAIIGGESGNETGKYQYRQMEWHWVDSLIDELQEGEVPVFVKQLGTYLAKSWNLKDRHGGDIDEWPEQLQIREFPKG